MTKVVIPQRTHLVTIIYSVISIVVLLLAFTILKMESISQGWGSKETIFLIAIVVLLFLMIFIIPNLSLKKHKKGGYLTFNPDLLLVEKSGKIIEFQINQVDSVWVRIVGYDGQHRLGDPKELRDTLRIRPLDGFGNIVRIRKGTVKYQYEFYIGTIPDSEAVKNIVRNWQSENCNVKLNILR